MEPSLHAWQERRWRDDWRSGPCSACIASSVAFSSCHRLCARHGAPMHGKRHGAGFFRQYGVPCHSEGSRGTHVSERAGAGDAANGFQLNGFQPDMATRVGFG